MNPHFEQTPPQPRAQMAVREAGLLSGIVKRSSMIKEDDQPVWRQCRMNPLRQLHHLMNGQIVRYFGCDDEIKRPPRCLLGYDAPMEDNAARLANTFLSLRQCRR